MNAEKHKLSTTRKLSVNGKQKTVVIKWKGFTKQNIVQCTVTQKSTIWNVIDSALLYH